MNAGPRFGFHQMRTFAADSLAGVEEDVRNAVANLTKIIEHPPQREALTSDDKVGPLYDTEETLLIEVARDQLKTVQRILWWVIGDPN